MQPRTAGRQKAAPVWWRASCPAPGSFLTQYSDAFQNLQCLCKTLLTVLKLTVRRPLCTAWTVSIYRSDRPSASSLPAGCPPSATRAAPPHRPSGCAAPLCFRTRYCCCVARRCRRACRRCSCSSATACLRPGQFLPPMISFGCLSKDASHRSVNVPEGLWHENMNCFLTQQVQFAPQIAHLASADMQAVSLSAVRRPGCPP